MNQPWSVVVTGTGCAIVADRGNGRIMGFDLTAAPGSGPDPTADPIADGFDRLRGIALDGNGDPCSPMSGCSSLVGSARRRVQRTASDVGPFPHEPA